MRITYFGSGSAIGFACRFRFAFNKAGIRGKILYLWKAIDIMDFIENDQAYDISDSRNLFYRSLPCRHG